MRDNEEQFIGLHKIPNYETLQRIAERYPSSIRRR